MLSPFIAGLFFLCLLLVITTSPQCLGTVEKSVFCSNLGSRHATYFIPPTSPGMEEGDRSVRVCVLVGEMGDNVSSGFEGGCGVGVVVRPLVGSLGEVAFVLVMVPRTEGASCWGWIVQISTTVLEAEIHS